MGNFHIVNWISISASNVVKLYGRLFNFSHVPQNMGENSNKNVENNVSIMAIVS